MLDLPEELKIADYEKYCTHVFDSVILGDNCKIVDTEYNLIRVVLFGSGIQIKAMDGARINIVCNDFNFTWNGRTRYEDQHFLMMNSPIGYRIIIQKK